MQVLGPWLLTLICLGQIIVSEQDTTPIMIYLAKFPAIVTLS